MKKLIAGLTALGLGVMGVLTLAVPAQASDLPTTCTSIEEVSHVVHHDAVTHEVIIVDTPAYDEVIPAVYETVHHDAVTSIVHHDAITHIVHHDAVTHTEWKYSKHGWNDEFIWVDNDTWKYLSWPSLNGSNQKPDWGWYYERTQDTRVITDQAAWDETIVDAEAYDETIIDTPAWDEQVIVTPEQIIHHDAVTHTEMVVDKEAWDETVIDVEARGCPEKPEPRVTTETWTDAACNDPRDGTATSTTYGQDTTYPMLWDAKAWTYTEGEGVIGKAYTIDIKKIDSELCTAPTPTETPTTPVIAPVVARSTTPPPAELASTGSNAGTGLLAALGAIILGGGMMLLTRKLHRKA